MLLGSNCIRDEGAIALAAAIKENRSLTCLDLNYQRNFPISCK